MSEGRAAHRLSLERIEYAATVIDPVFLRTPQFVSSRSARACRHCSNSRERSPTGSSARLFAGAT
jgi:hypothetical protein